MSEERTLIEIPPSDGVHCIQVHVHDDDELKYYREQAERKGYGIALLYHVPAYGCPSSYANKQPYSVYVLHPQSGGYPGAIQIPSMTDKDAGKLKEEYTKSLFGYPVVIETGKEIPEIVAGDWSLYISRRVKVDAFLKNAGWWMLNNIPLGPLAPHLLGWLMGSKPVKKDQKASTKPVRKKAR